MLTKVNEFAFRFKMLYLCVAKWRKPLYNGFSPLFSCIFCSKMGKIIRHVRKNMCRIIFFIRHLVFATWEMLVKEAS